MTSDRNTNSSRNWATQSAQKLTKMEAAETDPLLGQKNRAINSAPSRSGTEEMRDPAQWPQDSYDLFYQDAGFWCKARRTRTTRSKGEWILPQNLRKAEVLSLWFFLAFVMFPFGCVPWFLVAKEEKINMAAYFHTSISFAVRLGCTFVLYPVCKPP